VKNLEKIVRSVRYEGEVSGFKRLVALIALAVVLLFALGVVMIAVGAERREAPNEAAPCTCKGYEAPKSSYPKVKGRA
jgi:hypothetical protein